MSKNLLRALLALLLVGGVALAFVYRDRTDAAMLEDWVTGAGVAGALLFMALYAIATVLFLPGSMLTLAGGVLFGPVWGTLYNLAGATIGAVLAFLVARYLASDWVQARAGSGGRIGRLLKGVEAEGWRCVAFTRLVPLFPFNLLNWARTRNSPSPSSAAPIADPPRQPPCSPSGVSPISRWCAAV